MQYAVYYNKSFRHFNEVNEVIFDYQGTEAIVDFIPNLLKQEQKAIINISNIEDIKEIIPYLNKLKTVHENFIVQINFFTQTNIIELLEDNNINFMFSTFAKDYETFYSMIDLGAKEIYITEFLCFCLKNLQEIRKKKNIKFRVFPDIAQSARGTRKIIPEITKFWIRPEDTELYEQYIDTFEICRVDSRQSVVYEIYKKQQWSGQLEDLILDLDLKLNNTHLNPRFGQERINCCKKCTYGKCNLCTEMENLAARFEAADIIIKKEKKKIELSIEEKEKMINEFKKHNEEKLNES